MPRQQPTLTDGVVTLRPASGESGAAAFTIEVDATQVGECAVRPDGEVGHLSWALAEPSRGKGYAARSVTTLTDWALTDDEQGGLGLSRVQARVAPDNHPALRVATRAGLRREGVERGARGRTTVVLARVVEDPPLSDPESFRSLLNSFLPRKRAIAQVLVRDHDDRVLMCRLTYKRDWDLPGGVVEVGESPQLAAVRELEEELGLSIPPGDLLLTDWLPPWGGWDDAVCLVFDGGRHDAAVLDDAVLQAREIREARFLTLAEVEELAADFTTRRVRTAVSSPGTRYSESGHEKGPTPS